ncbi:MAG TPA: hypothetical protein VHX44_05385, partial [Planctomycetota bacterium]|nr:hypothetical protein [Planctomycetota bacterium]
MFTIRRKHMGLPLLCALLLACATVAVAVGVDHQAPTLTVDGPERSLRAWGYFTFSGTTSDDMGTVLLHIELDGWVNSSYTVRVDSLPGETKAWSMTNLIGN